MALAVTKVSCFKKKAGQNRIEMYLMYGGCVLYNITQLASMCTSIPN